AGLDELDDHRRMIGIAAQHSEWMASAQTVSHNQGRGNMRDFGSRIKSTGLRFRVTAAENIARLPRMALPTGQSFRVIDSSTCQFATNGGRAIPSHTYASLGAEVVEKWLNSPSHRANIMLQGLTTHGGMAGFDPRGQYCGDFYLTQAFLG
ncbi:MAG: CAP domain-containing protein, partial [Pseudomonadota bacterium]